MSPTTPTHTHHVSTPTHKLIDYSAIDTKKINVIGFHKGVVLYLAQKPSITSFYMDIFVQGAQYNIHANDPDNISATVGTMPPVLEPTALRYMSVALYNILKKEDVISSSFTVASSIKETSTCGF